MCDICSLEAGQENLYSCMEPLTMFIIGIKNMLTQLWTKEVLMGSKLLDLFGVDLMIMRISSSDIIQKESNVFF